MKKTAIVLPALLLFFITTTTNLFAQDVAYYNGQAKKEYENKNYYSAVDYATRSLNISANGEAYWWRGMARYYLKNYSDAITDFTNAIPYYSSDRTSLGNLYVWRADTKYAQGLYREAIADYDMTLSYGYENKKHVYWSQAAAYYYLKEHTKAKEWYTTAIGYARETADLAKLYKERGDNKAALTEYTDAIADYSKALDYDSRYVQAYWQRSYYRGKNLQYELAIADCTSAIHLLEQDASVSKANDLSVLYNNRGLYKYYLLKDEEAKADFQQSLRHNPNHEYANWDMGRVLYRLHAYAEANTYYLQAVSLLKTDIERSSCYADLHWSERAMLDYRQALQHLDATIRLNPDYKPYYWYRAYLQGIRKDYTNALLDYEKAISLYSADTLNTASLYIDMGLLKLKMKDSTGALRDLRRSVDLKPTYSGYYELGRFFKQVLKQDALGMLNLERAMKMTAAKDTLSTYAYAAAIKGDKATAVRVIEMLVAKAADNTGNLRSELHNAACIHALTGNTAKALQYLEQSLMAGYSDFDHLVNDRDLESLSPLLAYKSILLKYKVPTPKY